MDKQVQGICYQNRICSVLVAHSPEIQCEKEFFCVTSFFTLSNKIASASIGTIKLLLGNSTQVVLESRVLKTS